MRCQKRTDTTCGNSLVGQWEIQHRQQKHREKLSQTKATLDLHTPPAPQPHLTLYGRDYAVKKKATTEAAFSDLKMIQAIARTMTRPRVIPERQGPMSLNTEARKAEIYRVMHENHRLLDQIESVKPFCRADDLITEHRDKHKYVINASHTTRLAGEYDRDIRRIRAENKDKWDQQKKQVAKRIEAGLAKRASGTVSLPAILPEARSPSGAPRAARRVPPSGSKAASSSGSEGIRRSKGASGSGAASSGSPKGDSAEEPPKLHRESSGVRFTATGPMEEDECHEQEPKTPHPKKGTRDVGRASEGPAAAAAARGELLSAEELVVTPAEEDFDVEPAPEAAPALEGAASEGSGRDSDGDDAAPAPAEAAAGGAAPAEAATEVPRSQPQPVPIMAVEAAVDDFEGEPAPTAPAESAAAAEDSSAPSPAAPVTAVANEAAEEAEAEVEETKAAAPAKQEAEAIAQPAAENTLAPPSTPSRLGMPPSPTGVEDATGDYEEFQDEYEDDFMEDESPDHHAATVGNNTTDPFERSGSFEPDDAS